MRKLTLVLTDLGDPQNAVRAHPVFDPLTADGVLVKVGYTIYWQNCFTGGVFDPYKYVDSVKSLPQGAWTMIDREDVALEAAMCGMPWAFYEMKNWLDLAKALRPDCRFAYWSVGSAPMQFVAPPGNSVCTWSSASAAQKKHGEKQWLKQLPLMEEQGIVLARGYDQYAGDNPAEIARNVASMEMCGKHSRKPRILGICHHRAGAWNLPLLPDDEFIGSQIKPCDGVAWWWTAGMQLAEKPKADGSPGPVPVGTLVREVGDLVDAIVDWRHG